MPIDACDARQQIKKRRVVPEPPVRPASTSSCELRINHAMVFTSPCRTNCRQWLLRGTATIAGSPPSDLQHPRRSSQYFRPRHALAVDCRLRTTSGTEERRSPLSASRFMISSLGLVRSVRRYHHSWLWRLHYPLPRLPAGAGIGRPFFLRLAFVSVKIYTDL